MGWKVALALLAAIALAAIGLSALGRSRWDAGTRELRERLDAARLVPADPVYRESRLDGLPAPVSRYLRAALTDGQPLIATADLVQAGTIDMAQHGPPDWKPFTATQRVVMARPGFDWDARVRIAPGLHALVHDAYVAGEGVLVASAAGLVRLAAQRGAGDIARGELMRFLAESVWYPTALLPSERLRWEPVDATQARATLADGAIRVSLVFGFGADGLIERVHAEARGRSVGERIVPTPWEGRFSDYTERDGMRIPQSGEVGWVIDGVPRAYWRGRMTAVRYTFHAR